MTVLNVTMNPDGTAYVQQKHSGGRLWSYDEQSDAITAMGQCCAMRRGIPDNCPCLACEVGKVAKRWRAEQAEEAKRRYE